MMQEIFGVKFAYILDFCIALSNFGYLIIYITIFADYLLAFIN